MTSTTAATDVVDVILRDGSTLRLRAPVADDRQALVRFFRELSDRSLYLRFHGHPTVDERLVDPVVDPDWADRGALIGSVVESGEELVVALGNYVRLRDPLTAEVAFAVADDYQARGIGTRPPSSAARAASHGIERFVGEVMADNSAMIHVSRRSASRSRGRSPEERSR
jgi:RimJ/RimL family protein N-acetyltransferase